MNVTVSDEMLNDFSVNIRTEIKVTSASITHCWTGSLGAVKEDKEIKP